MSVQKDILSGLTAIGTARKVKTLEKKQAESQAESAQREVAKQASKAEADARKAQREQEQAEKAEKRATVKAQGLKTRRERAIRRRTGYDESKAQVALDRLRAQSASKKSQKARVRQKRFKNPRVTRIV